VTAPALLDDPIGWLRAHAEWLFAPSLGVCLVGSQALAIACRRAGISGPSPRDLDLAWALDIVEGQRLLEQHGVFLATTEGNLQRGTLALKLGGLRLEVTSFRDGAPHNPIDERIQADLMARDMTIGALAVQIASGEVHDPCGGLAHWRERRVVPVGDVAQRVHEHPVRWIRYVRKANEWEFELDRTIRKLRLPLSLLDSLPREAIAQELRAALLQCRSPGRFFVDLHELELLAHLSPELARQFDGRPAGPQRWHPEISQALHLVLALEWAAQNSRHLEERDRLTVMLAVLLHDLGKGYTDDADLPSHPGHERGGLRHVDAFFRRIPGLLDQRGVSVVRDVTALHVEIRNLHELRSGTLAKLYDEHFRGGAYPVEVFALAVAADSAGRLGHENDGPRYLAQVQRDLHWLREVCAGVDAAALRERFADLELFRKALHEERAHAISHARSARSQD
jgi:tRNA nucleotidyltransferase (CCA-adding enzyme)